MDRPTVFSGELARSVDFLLLGQSAMVGLAKLSETTLGTATTVDGFTLTPTSPASLEAVLSGGSIYEQENLEATQWSSLPANSTIIVKQGIALNPQTLTFAAPTTVGYAQCFLVEASYLDVDTGSVVAPYYNAANPAIPYSGPGNAGTANNTVRQGAVAIQVKAGIAAPSGTQLVPGPDPGWAGLYVVTLAQGATSVTAGNIATYSGAPFVLAKLPAVPAAVQAGGWLFAGTTTSSGNAFTANLLPAPAAFPVGMRLRAKMNAAPTGASTFVLNGTTFSIQRRAGAACIGGEWAAGDIVDFNVLSPSALQIAGLTLPDVPAPYYGEDTGTADALVVTLSPSPVTLVEGTVVRVEKGATSNKTTAPTLKIMNMASGSPQTFNLLKSSGTALAVADLFASSELEFILDQNGYFRRVGLTASDVVSTTIASGSFQQLVANPILYVGGAGASDSNSGATSGSPKATIAGAIVAAAAFSFATTSLTLQVAAGSYAMPAIIGALGGPLIINGAGAGSTTLTGACTYTAAVTITNVTLSGPGPFGTVLAQLGGNVTLSNVTVSTGGGFCAIETGAGGIVSIGTGVTLTGNGTYCLYANGGSIFLANSGTITVAGNPTYSQYFAIAANEGSIFVNGTASFSGSATCIRYGVANVALIQTNGGGANFFPGTAAGTPSTSTGGYYV